MSICVFRFHTHADFLFVLTIWNLQPQFQKSWDILQNVINSKIPDLLILFKLYLTYKGTKKNILKVFTD